MYFTSYVARYRKAPCKALQEIERIDYRIRLRRGTAAPSLGLAVRNGKDERRWRNVDFKTDENGFRGEQIWPEMVQNGPKRAPRWPQMQPERPMEAERGPEMPQNGPRSMADGAKMGQRGPKVSPRRPKMAQERLKIR